MSTTCPEPEREHEPLAAPAAPNEPAKRHQKLAPKISPSVRWSHGKSVRAIADQSEAGPQPQQRQDQSNTPQFAFINTTTDVQYSGRGSRTAARSHVMRNFHRSKGKARLQQTSLAGSSEPLPLLAAARARQPPALSRASSRLSDVDDVLLHRLDGDARRDLPDLGEERSAFDSSALWLQEPWHQGGHEETRYLPISNLWALPVDAHATELIYHYIQIFAKTFIPMEKTWESEWFKNALTDPACFHGTLFLSAAHKALLMGNDNPLPVECFQHKGEAIRIINERLSDPSRRVTDGTIASIACLAAFETLGGTVTDATVYVHGLEKMVGMRGGLKQLGMNGYLEQFLYWVDLSNATATKERAHFLPFEVRSISSKYSDTEALWKYCDSQWNEEILPPIPMKSYQGMDVVETRLLHRLRQLTILAASITSTVDGPNQQAYANSVLLFERYIGLAVQERVAFNRKFGSVTLSPPTCLFYIPALVICYMILRLTPVRSSIYDLLVTRMKGHIDDLMPRQLFDRFQPEFWFWALLFVGAASMGRPQQGHFQRIMIRLCNLLDVHSWEDAKAVVQEFAWVDSICERPCKAFWDTLEGTEGISRTEEEVETVGDS